MSEHISSVCYSLCNSVWGMTNCEHAFMRKPQVMLKLYYEQYAMVRELCVSVVSLWMEETIINESQGDMQLSFMPAFL